MIVYEKALECGNPEYTCGIDPYLRLGERAWSISGASVLGPWTFNHSDGNPLHAIKLPVVPHPQVRIEELHFVRRQKHDTPKMWPAA